MPTLTKDILGRFQELVYLKSDLHFSERKQAFFEGRLMGRLEALGLSDYESYYSYLKQAPGELDMLVQGLTTNKTSFFRNPAQFKALRDLVIPEIVEARNREVISSWGSQASPARPVGRHPAMSLRIWSSGCSTGEEAYSLAFTLLETLKFPRAWDVEVLATDIGADVLDRARMGIYDEESVREMDPGLAEKYMDKTGDGFAIKPAVKGLVKFYESNLKGLTSARPCRLSLKSADGVESALDVEGRFDVIFCRNVMIYFDREGQQRLVSALFDCLRFGGYLFTGDSEPLHLFKHGFVRADAEEALYYKKPVKGAYHARNL